MRDFRDNYVALHTEGPHLLEEYYRVSPAIVQQIKADLSREAVFLSLLGTLRRIVFMIRTGHQEDALNLCKKTFVELRHKYKTE